MTRLFLLALAVALASSTAYAAGTMTGRVFDDCGTGIYELQVWPTASGVSTSYEHKTTDTSGYYTITNLPAGTYCVGVSDTFHFRKHFYANVVIRDNEVTVVDFPLHNTYTVHTHNDQWSTTWYAEFGQTFVSTGGSIVMITTRVASDPADFVVSVHDGGPNGPQIGPSRYFYGVGQSGRGTVAWINGEVPTIKGQTYYAKIKRINGATWSCYIDGNDNGQTYPYGQAYYNKVAQPNIDLQLFIETDDDGISTFYRVKDGAGGGNAWSEVGQTFVAKGANIIGASATIGASPNTLVVFSVHSGGPGGAQIGPSKTVRIWDCQTGLVQWQPGEVPVTPGQTYYLKVRRADGATLYAFYNDNQYPYGQMYINGVAQSGWDLRSTIMGEVTAGASSCTISGYVRDSVGNPISGAAVSTTKCGYTATSGPDGRYTLTVTGDTYDLRCHKDGYMDKTVTGYTAVRGTTQTLDWTFAVGSLENTGFETVDASDNTVSWAEYGHGLRVQTGTGYGGITPHGGQRYATNEASWTDPKTGGVYQIIGIMPGTHVLASVWAACYGLGGGAAHTFDRIGIDPTGGNNPASASIHWSPWYSSPSDAFWEWTQIRTAVTTTGSFLTIFIDYKQEARGAGYAYEWQANAFDDVTISTPGLTSLADAKQLDDGSYAYLGPAVVTAKFPADPTCFYVEDPNRALGVRVEGDTSYSIGDMVKVGGTIRTTLGERCIDSPCVDLVQSGVGDLDPLGMTNRYVGGGANGAVPGVTDGVGANNIGLLVTAWGRVTVVDSTSFYLDDGSGVPVKVQAYSGSDMPADGAYAVVTGISSTYDAGGGIIGRLIRARSGGVTSY